MDVFEGKNKRYRKQLTKFGQTKSYEVILERAAMFAVSFVDYWPGLFERWITLSTG